MRVDGAELKDWDPERLARHVGYLPQDSGLLAGSVRDNVSRFEAWRGPSPPRWTNRPSPPRRPPGVHEMVLRLPQGYDTVIGIGGRGLSAGQTQRVALARALYRQPHILILDEPNSNLDADGEVALVRALGAAKERGAAILLVAHRSGVLGISDKLALLKDGVLELYGPRDEVVARLNENAPRRPRVAATPAVEGESA